LVKQGRISGMNPRPLGPLFSSPRQLLEKAHRDLERLERATSACDEVGCCDAMLDASLSVYHVKDWIGVMHPESKDAAEKYAHGSAWILLCRDICHASKHVSLRLKDRTDQVSPQNADYVDYTTSASVGTFAGLPVLKVFSAQHGDHYAPNVIRGAIEDWKNFLVGTQIL
jgi:hypothetical protein